MPTSSTASGLLIRPPHQQIAMGVGPPQSSILIGSGGLNSNNPSILAQSPSNLGKSEQFSHSTVSSYWEGMGHKRRKQKEENKCETEALKTHKKKISTHY